MTGPWTDARWPAGFLVLSSVGFAALLPSSRLPAAVMGASYLALVLGGAWLGCNLGRVRPSGRRELAGVLLLLALCGGMATLQALLPGSWSEIPEARRPLEPRWFGPVSLLAGCLFTAAYRAASGAADREQAGGRAFAACFFWLVVLMALVYIPVNFVGGLPTDPSAFENQRFYIYACSVLTAGWTVCFLASK